MKILKKINKGLILTVIVILALTIYLKNIEKQRNADKADIRKACEEFISLTDKYAVLPEEMQKLGEKQNEDKIEKYIKQMETELEKVMISNKDAVEIQRKIFEKNLRDGYNELEARTKQTRRIVKITEYQFNGNQVTVSFLSELRRDIKYFDGFSEKTESKKFDTNNDCIKLQKIDGEWKVTYSNFEFEQNQMYQNYLELK